MALHELSSTDVSKLLSARGKVYGDSLPNLAASEEMFRLIDKYWTIQCSIEPMGEMDKQRLDSMKGALKMVGFKLTRIVTGNKDHWDNFDDLIGYLEIARERARELTRAET